MLIGFKRFLEEETNGTLQVVDIDDTLFHTTARIGIKKDGKVTHYLSNSKFNKYELKPGEEYDFGEFRNAKKFRAESEPIKPMIDKMKKMQNSKKNKIIINTARADFDDKNEFLNTFRDYGIDIDKIHVHRAGNEPGPIADKKVKIVKGYIDKHAFKKVVMYDDHEPNLEELLNMVREYPKIKFIAFHVKPDGSMSRYYGEK
jgi:hypothetical protein